MRKHSHVIKRRKLGENPVCFVCQMGVEPILELHHILPIANGGEDSDENTVLLCPNCHSFHHFMSSKRSEKYFNEDTLIKDMIRMYSPSPIVEYRLKNLMDGYIIGLKNKIGSIEKEDKIC